MRNRLFAVAAVLVALAVVVAVSPAWWGPGVATAWWGPGIVAG